VDRLHVATLNIRNIADRWDERLPLLLADMAALQPDLLGLQEVVFAVQQDRVIGAAGAARYQTIRAPAGRPEYGNALLVRETIPTDAHDRLDLGLNRSALRVLAALPGGGRVLVAVTHLHHPAPDREERDRQAETLLDWLATAPQADAIVAMGDFNADPAEPAYARMVAAGFRSAHLEANGAEPPATWPSGIQAPGIDKDGHPGCLDYIWVRGAARVESCRLAFDRPAVGDPTLYPSDHFGLAAHLVLG